MNELAKLFLVLLGAFMVSVGIRQIALAVTTDTIMDLALGPDNMALDRIRHSEQPIRFAAELLVSLIIKTLGGVDKLVDARLGG